MKATHRFILDFLTCIVFGICIYHFICLPLYEAVKVSNQSEMQITIHEALNKYNKNKKPRLETKENTANKWRPEYTKSLLQTGSLSAENIINIERNSAKKHNQEIKNEVKVLAENSTILSTAMYEAVNTLLTKNPTRYKIDVITSTLNIATDFLDKGKHRNGYINKTLNRKKHKAKYNTLTRHYKQVCLITKQSFIHRIFNKYTKDKNNKYFFPLKTAFVYKNSPDLDATQKASENAKSYNIFVKQQNNISIIGNIFIIQDKKTKTAFVIYQNSRQTKDTNASEWKKTSTHLIYLTQNVENNINSELQKIGLDKVYSEMQKHYKGIKSDKKCNLFIQYF